MYITCHKGAFLGLLGGVFFQKTGYYGTYDLLKKTYSQRPSPVEDQGTAPPSYFVGRPPGGEKYLHRSIWAELLY